VGEETWESAWGATSTWAALRLPLADATPAVAAALNPIFIKRRRDILLFVILIILLIIFI